MSILIFCLKSITFSFAMVSFRVNYINYCHLFSLRFEMRARPRTFKLPITQHELSLYGILTFAWRYAAFTVYYLLIFPFVECSRNVSPLRSPLFYLLLAPVVAVRVSAELSSERWYHIISSTEARWEKAHRWCLSLDLRPPLYIEKHSYCRYRHAFALISFYMIQSSLSILISPYSLP